jgi:drug/metabolite transporter (DMT)-like permease
LLLLVITTVGWGMNWPAMKVLLAELPPLTTRAIGGGLGFIVLLVVVMAQKQSLVVPRAIWGRLTLISLLNVTAWMGLASFSLLWLSASEATIICYTMPVWAAVFAWLILGEKPSLARILALVLALSGLVYLVLGKGLDLGIAKLPGVALGLGSAVLFALGTVLTKRMPLGLPPSSAVAWQVGIGVAPLFIAALIFDPLDFSHVSALGVGLLIYGGVTCIAWHCHHACSGRVGCCAVPGRALWPSRNSGADLGIIRRGAGGAWLSASVSAARSACSRSVAIAYRNGGGIRQNPRANRRPGTALP